MSSRLGRLRFSALAAVAGAVCVIALSVANAEVKPPQADQPAKNPAKSGGEANRSRSTAGPTVQAVKPGGSKPDAARTPSTTTAAVQAVKPSGSKADAARTSPTTTAAAQAAKPSGSKPDAARTRSAATATVQAVKPGGSKAAQTNRSQLAALATQPDAAEANKQGASRSSISEKPNQTAQGPAKTRKKVRKMARTRFPE